MTLLAQRPPDEVDESELVVGRRIQEFSQLAGPIREPDPAEGAYRVAYRGVDAVHGRGRVARSLLVAGLNFAFEALFFLWLLHPSHRPPVFGSTFAIYANWIVIGSIGLIELLRLVDVCPTPTPRWSPATRSRWPRTAPGSPSSPPSCPARSRWRWCGPRWRARCASGTTGRSRLAAGRGRRPGGQGGVRAARRTPLHPQGRREVEPAQGRASRRRPSTATTTPGSTRTATSTSSSPRVDTDHVPLPNYLERMLGYFRDPDVAFVVGPQVYGNYDTFVTRAAESQQFLVPRADPARRQPLRRRDVRRHQQRRPDQRRCGRSAACTTRSPRTWPPASRSTAPQPGAPGSKWSRCTPRTCWRSARARPPGRDFFTQQMRWSRGTYETLLKQYLEGAAALSPGGLCNYTLMIDVLPDVGHRLGARRAQLPACSWRLGASGVDRSRSSVADALQRRRRAPDRAVPLEPPPQRLPHEPEGSSGIKGMLMSIFAAPIFAASLIATILRLPAKFVVTPRACRRAPTTS